MDFLNSSLDSQEENCSLELMKETISSNLYAWSKDLEASSSVLRREVPAFAMLLGWSRKGLCPTRLVLLLDVF